VPSFFCHTIRNIKYRSRKSGHILSLGVFLVGDMHEEGYIGDGWNPF
jgi:hypothetical protein